MKLSVKDKLAAGRLKACRTLPYFRVAIMNMIPKEAPGLGTFATTKKAVMLWDAEVVKEWSVEQIAGVVLHEVSHLLRHHADRCERIKADPRGFNIAGDAEINDDLLIAGVPLPGSPVTPKSLDMENGLTAEEYYRGMPEDKKDGGDGDGESGEGEKDGPGQPGNGKPKVGHGQCGGCAGNPVPGEEEAAGEEGRSEVEIERMKRAVAEAIRDQVSKGQGKVPGSWARWAEATLGAPKVPWQQKLAKMARGCLAYRPGAVDYKWTHVSRRQSAVGYGMGVPVLPALRAPVPKVAFIMDTSGSMGKADLEAGMSEARGVLKSCGADMTFCACDAAVHSLKKVRSIQEAVSLVKGGGGTDFRPAFEAIAPDKPDLVVFATDGYGTAPATPPPFKVIWLLVGKPRKAPAEWGEVVELDS